MKKIMALFVDISIDWKRVAKHFYMEGIKPMHITIDNLLKFDYNKTKVDCIIFDYSLHNLLGWRNLSDEHISIEFMPCNIPRILWTAFIEIRHDLRPQDWFVQKEVMCPEIYEEYMTKRCGMTSHSYVQFTDVYQTSLSNITDAIKMACNTDDSI